MSSFQNQFSTLHDVRNPAPIRRAVIIASTQRSGSSLLGHTLRDTGRFGVPLEYFNVQNLAHWKKRFDFTSVNGFLDHVERRRTTSNGVFAIKSHYFQLRHFGTIRDLQTRYRDCRFVRIVRRDVLGQAISRTVAQQTGVWISGQKKTGDASYSFAQIAENLRVLSQQHQQWSLAFAATGTEFLQVTHEDMVADPIAQTRRIAMFCDVSEDSLTFADAPPIKPQSHSGKNDWAVRFSDEFDEKSEALLRGHQAPTDAVKDLGRWARIWLGKSDAAESWRPSPNLAE